MADSDIQEYHCPNCGGVLKVTPGKTELSCESCDSTFENDVVKAYDKEQENLSKPTKIDWTKVTIEENEDLGEQTGFSCTSCGAEVVSNGQTTATECMYCGNQVVVVDNISGLKAPDYIIPFDITREQAEKSLKDFYKGKLLLPKAFKEKNRIEKIANMYVPFWLFDAGGSGNVEFSGEIHSHWSDSSYDYHKIDYYSVLRSGNMAFSRIPVDASEKMEDNYMDGLEPYDYTSLIEFESKYFVGSFADKYDVSVEDCKERVDERVENSTVDVLKSTIQEVYNTLTLKSASIQMDINDVRYAMLPVWMLNTKYQDKMFQFAVNGQTGKVSGELPIHKGKLWAYRIGIFLLSLLLSVPLGILIASLFE